jgi:hypothetical protein
LCRRVWESVAECESVADQVWEEHRDAFGCGLGAHFLSELGSVI